MALRIYTYKNCDTCRKALKFLDAHNIQYTNIPIREQPPTKAELKKMLGYLDGELKRLFNTSGMDYRSMNLKDTLPTMTTKEAIELLNKNGNLVKRPFILGATTGTVGFKKEDWRELFK
ncbi:MAG: ArsC family transcriptional regulator [Candidatus Hydrogenedentota bacterium]|nr:MAG: ArsC family transcriptional regulator [Candidatus Hydrogenedentota bacterium]